MIKTLLIEDEINVRSALKKMLHIITPNIEIVAETGLVSEAIELIKTQKPDLIFLDIELEDGTGFDILKQVENLNSKTIFTTAYNQYAIKAFKFSAVDYLLKPIDPEELQNATNRAIKDIKNKKEYQELLSVLKNNLQEKEQKIILKTTEQRYVIAVKDIIYLEADGAYTVFITTNNSVIVSKNLKYYQELLPDNFIRCHQSFLVNKNHIEGLNKQNQITLSYNNFVPISTRKKAEITEIISKL